MGVVTAAAATVDGVVTAAAAVNYISCYSISLWVDAVASAAAVAVAVAVAALKDPHVWELLKVGR